MQNQACGCVVPFCIKCDKGGLVVDMVVQCARRKIITFYFFINTLFIMGDKTPSVRYISR